MNKLINIFPVPLYIGEVRDKEKLNAALLNSTIITENKLRKYERFSGDFNNSFGHEENLDEDWIDILLGEIMLGLKEYVKSITKQGKSTPSEINLIEIWFNSYEKGQYQETHSHLAFGIRSPFSFIYYLKLPKDSPGQTVFVNDGYGKCESFYSDHLNVVVPKIAHEFQEGRYIIFPSFLTHYVTHHSSEHERRITVAGNIQLRYEE